MKKMCRHICALCRHKEKCDWYYYNKLSKKELIEDNQRLHAIIEELTEQLDEAEVNAYYMQEKLEEVSRTNFIDVAQKMKEEWNKDRLYYIRLQERRII